MNRKEYQAEYMRKRRSNPVYRQKERERNREYKKMKRRTDEEWLARERARRREYGKVSRYRNKDKDKVGREKYLLKNKAKVQARNAIMHAVKKGMKRPDACERCQWICKDCDGEQLRSKQKLVHD